LRVVQPTVLVASALGEGLERGEVLQRRVPVRQMSASSHVLILQGQLTDQVNLVRVVILEEAKLIRERAQRGEL
jgi:hypothetical protein